MATANPAVVHGHGKSKYPMDTAHSWLIFACSFLVAFIAFGQLMSFGIYYSVFSEYFHLDKRATGLIGAVCFTVCNMIGPLAGVLQRRYGARLVIMTGGLLAATGMVSSYFARDAWHLYISYGLLVGLGFGLTANPAVSILPEYFERHRYLVTTLMSIGGSLGTLVLAPFSLFLVESYTWRGAMLISGGLCLQLIVLGSLMHSRAIDRHADLKELMKISVFKDPRYVMVLLDGAMFGGAGFVVYSILTDFAHGRGLSPWESATLISITSASTTIARIVAAFLSSVRGLDRVALYACTTATGGLAVLGIYFSHTFWTFAASLVVFGFSFGIKVSQLVNVVIDLVGVQGIAVGIGYFMFSLGLGGFSVPLLAGWIADKHGPDKAFLLVFLAIMLGFCCCVTILILRRRQNRRAAKSAKQIEAEEEMNMEVAAEHPVAVE